jgi:DNA-binding NtrC family response regulator
LEHFLAVYARKYDVPRCKISADALALLEKYPWPGNVRELRHAVERATILASSDRLVPADFPFALIDPARICALKPQMRISTSSAWRDARLRAPSRCTKAISRKPRQLWD